MFLLITIIVISLGLGFVLVYCTGLTNISPYFWILLPFIGIIASGFLISLAWGGLLLAASKYKKVDNRGSGSKFYQFWTVALAKLMLLGSWSILKKKNFGKIPKSGTCLYLFNHTSFVDCWMLLACIHPHLFSIVSHIAMKKVPMVGNVATALGTIYVDREDPESSHLMMERCVDYLKNKNTSIALSPEGTINRTGKLFPFKNGAFKIALESERPIVLFYFKGIGKMDHRKHIFAKCPIEAEVIDVIYPETYRYMNARQLAQYTQEIYQSYEYKQNALH